MRTPALGLVGAGFWAKFQTAAWGEVPGARVAAICDRDEAKAAVLARTLGIQNIYGPFQ